MIKSLILLFLLSFCTPCFALDWCYEIEPVFGHKLICFKGDYISFGLDEFSFGDYYGWSPPEFRQNLDMHELVVKTDESVDAGIETTSYLANGPSRFLDLDEQPPTGDQIVIKLVSNLNLASGAEFSFSFLNDPTNVLVVSAQGPLHLRLAMMGGAVSASRPEPVADFGGAMPLEGSRWPAYEPSTFTQKLRELLESKSQSANKNELDSELDKDCGSSL
jgi:hypothetical protein